MSKEKFRRKIRFLFSQILEIDEKGEKLREKTMIDINKIIQE